LKNKGRGFGGSDQGIGSIQKDHSFQDSVYEVLCRFAITDKYLLLRKRAQMDSLYPFKFTPVYKEKIWGGQKINQVLHHEVGDLSNCGEAWLVSGVNDDPSVVSNGFLAGNELNELVEVYMGDLVGEKVYDTYGDIFPILVKVIDSNDWLSVQVHPDDELAEKMHIGSGKTEMWYVLQSDDKAQLISGFNQKIDQVAYQKALENKKLKDILQFVEAKKEDVFFIPSGKIHALGPGLLIAEIQQTSDNTFRVYDWDRVDEKGIGRQLHTAEALQAIDFENDSEAKSSYRIKSNGSSTLVNCEYFTTNIVDLDKPLRKDYSEIDSFVILMCVGGSCELRWEGQAMHLDLSETVLIPNLIEEIEIYPKGNCKLLEVYIP
jgi:mannose-6-phosphate isomerase